MRPSSVAGIAVGILVLAASSLSAQMEQHEHHGAPAERLGTVSFPISCSAASQAKFTRAVALLHSFWYEEAEKAFLEIAKAGAEPSGRGIGSV